MDQDGHEWFSELREYAWECRRTMPLPTRNMLSAQQEAQCRIVGATVLSWLREQGPLLRQERTVSGAGRQLSHDPWIVFTSNAPGLIAAEMIFLGKSDRLVCLTDAEFAGWLTCSPDPHYEWHVHFWSLFLDQCKPDFLGQALRRHPIAASSSASSHYWQQTEGTIWAEDRGYGADHLWEWDGTSPALVREELTRWAA